MSTVIAPPFTDPELAARKVQIAEDLWNTRDPERVAAAYTEDTQWRNRTEFLSGRAEVVAFLKRKWVRELDYKLRKELWEFAPSGLMQRREASINDLAIAEAERTL